MAIEDTTEEWQWKQWNRAQRAAGRATLTIDQWRRQKVRTEQEQSFRSARPLRPRVGARLRRNLIA